MFFFEELFFYNKYGLKFKFLMLFEDFKCFDLEYVVRIFIEVVVKIDDVVVFVNVVRFFVKKEFLLFLEVKDFI